MGFAPVSPLNVVMYRTPLRLRDPEQRRGKYFKGGESRSWLRAGDQASRTAVTPGLAVNHSCRSSLVLHAQHKHLHPQAATLIIPEVVVLCQRLLPEQQRPHGVKISGLTPLLYFIVRCHKSSDCRLPLAGPAAAACCCAAAAWCSIRRGAPCSTANRQQPVRNGSYHHGD